jgi:hypothetical protein
MWILQNVKHEPRNHAFTQMCIINIIFDTKTWEKQTLVTVPMVPTFVNAPHNDPFMRWFNHKNNHVLKLKKFNQLMLLTMSLNN